MRLIDADKLNKKKKYVFQTKGGCFPKSEWFIKADDLFAAQTVDAVEVVRCKDCKWFGTSRLGKGWCNEVMASPVSDNDYCSYGERRAEG